MARMKAMVRHQYGGPEVLQFEDVEVPEPGEGELRLKVEFASVNPADRYMLLGTPKLVRIRTGFGQPKDPGFGSDVAGVVDALGPNVTGFALGDRVVGASRAGFAQFATVRSSHAALIPEGVTTSDAAVLPVAACTALQGLTRGNVGAGTKLLVNGASGGVGHFAVQLAVAMGAEVTAVCSGRNVDLVRGLGAQEVLDYVTTDYTTLGRQWDVLLDNQGNHSPAANRDALVKGGIWVTIGGPMTSPTFGPIAYIVRSAAACAFSSRSMKQFIADEDAATLVTLLDQVAKGDVVPHIERTFALAELGDAISQLGTGRTRGKVLIGV